MEIKEMIVYEKNHNAKSLKKLIALNSSLWNLSKHYWLDL